MQEATAGDSKNTAAAPDESSTLSTAILLHQIIMELRDLKWNLGGPDREVVIADEGQTTVASLEAQPRNVVSELNRTLKGPERVISISDDEQSLGVHWRLS
jgi:hypothetical protein